jgi:8-oxo-dGTP diphosphatase
MEHTPTAEGAPRPIAVGIALVSRRGCYLVRQRRPGSAMAGYWEFPGGKCEAGETPAEATARECREEIGLEVVVGRLRREVEHRYPHDWVRLSYYDCVTSVPDAEPDPSTGFRWVRADALVGLRFPEANEPVLKELANIPAADPS